MDRILLTTNVEAYPSLSRNRTVRVIRRAENGDALVELDNGIRVWVWANEFEEVADADHGVAGDNGNGSDPH